jgi:hypothetical protein
VRRSGEAHHAVARHAPLKHNATVSNPRGIPRPIAGLTFATGKPTPAAMDFHSGRLGKNKPGGLALAGSMS